MSLDELINESDDDAKEWLAEAETILQMSGVKYQKEKLHKEDVCCACGSSNTEQVSYYWRCHADDCDTITYIPI